MVLVRNILKLILVLLLAHESMAFANPSLSFMGHLAIDDASVNSVSVEFWLESEITNGGSAMFTKTIAPSNGVPLNDGFFQVEVSLLPNDVQKLQAAAEKIFTKISVTYGGGSGSVFYPFQALQTVPMALKVPVDGKTLNYVDGKLSTTLAVIRRQVVNANNEVSPVSTEAKSAPYTITTVYNDRNTTLLDLDILADLCADDDGCQFTITVKDRTKFSSFIHRRGQFFWEKDQHRWIFFNNTSNQNHDARQDDTRRTVSSQRFNIFGLSDCYFTERKEVNGVFQSSQDEFYVIQRAAGSRECTLEFED